MQAIFESRIVNVMLENAPAVVVLLVIAWRQQRMIDKFVDTCIDHLLGRNGDGEHIDNNR